VSCWAIQRIGVLSVAPFGSEQLKHPTITLKLYKYHCTVLSHTLLETGALELLMLFSVPHFKYNRL
jgi:hypothetical protein